MKVLFVLNSYYTQQNAVTNCVLKLQNALLDKNVHSDIVTIVGNNGSPEANKYGNIYSITGKKTLTDHSFIQILVNFFSKICFFLPGQLEIPFN
jgi:hypothetical protein